MSEPSSSTGRRVTYSEVMAQMEEMENQNLGAGPFIALHSSSPDGHRGLLDLVEGLNNFECSDSDEDFDFDAAFPARFAYTAGGKGKDKGKGEGEGEWKRVKDIVSGRSMSSIGKGRGSDKSKDDKGKDDKGKDDKGKDDDKVSHFKAYKSKMKQLMPGIHVDSDLDRDDDEEPDDKDSNKGKSKSSDEEDNEAKGIQNEVDDSGSGKDDTGKVFKTEEQLKKMTKDRLHRLLSSHNKRVSNKSKCLKGDMIRLILDADINWQTPTEWVRLLG